MRRPAESGWLLWAALATIYIVWGSTYLAIRVMVETMPPLLAAGARYAVAGGIFWAILRIGSDPGREERRHRVDHHADCEVGGSPDDVDRQ